MFRKTTQCKRYKRPVRKQLLQAPSIGARAWTKTSEHDTNL